MRAALAAASLALALGAPDGGVRSGAQLKSELDSTLAAARTARDAKHPDEAISLYGQACDLATQAWHAGAFGTQKTRFPIGDISKGDFRTMEMDIPSGVEIPGEIAREAAHAAASLGMRDEALRFAWRQSSSLGLSLEGELPGQVAETLEALRKEARATGHADDAAYYGAIVDKAHASQEARWARQAADKQRFRFEAAGIALAIQLAIGWLLSRLWRLSLAARREASPLTRADFVAFSSVRIDERNRDGHPTRWHTTWADLISRVALTWLLWMTVPLALFGAVAFARLAWDKGELGVSLLCYGLAILFVSFSGFMVGMLLAPMQNAVRREVELRERGMLVRTWAGFLRARLTEELFPFSAIQSLGVIEHVQHVQHGTIRYYLAVVGVEGRGIVVGGGKQERARELLSGLEKATGRTAA